MFLSRRWQIRPTSFSVILSLNIECFYSVFISQREFLPFLNRGRKKDAEYGVARGIDFQFVSNVINFDFPLTPSFYVHRVGRTARAGQMGTALSFVSLGEEKLLRAVESLLNPAGEAASLGSTQGSSSKGKCNVFMRMNANHTCAFCLKKCGNTSLSAKEKRINGSEFLCIVSVVFIPITSS